MSIKREISNIINNGIENLSNVDEVFCEIQKMCLTRGHMPKNGNLFNLPITKEESNEVSAQTIRAINSSNQTEKQKNKWKTLVNVLFQHNKEITKKPEL